MKKSKNPAFTLAEVMIVLTVIGVLSAILLPVAFHSTPDKNILRFKKTYNDFARVIRDLASSGEHYLPGDLGIKPDGTLIDGTHAGDYYYFCETVADSLAIKSADCETLYGDDSWGMADEDLQNLYYSTDYTYEPAWMDNLCARTENAPAGFIRTVDDIYIINHSPYSLLVINPADFFPGVTPTQEDLKKYIYKFICIDLDEPQKGIKPFAIAFRRDGKLKLGARAKWWLERDINKKETDCCALSNVEASNVGSYVNLCDTGDTICP